MMILRVYTMWNRSRTILRVLLLIYVVQTTTSFIYAGIYFNPNTHLSGMPRIIVVVSVHLNHISAFPVTLSLATIAQVPDASWCFILLNAPPNLTIYFMIPRFVLSAVLFILALTQTLKQSVAMYKATKQWQPNRYMMLLVQHGIIYFFTYVDRFLRFICAPHLPQHFPRCYVSAQTTDSND